MARRVFVVALIALVAAGVGVGLVAGAGAGLERRQVTVGGVPLTEVHPAAAGGRRPGVVVAHGFAGSARLMAPFGDSLAARGYVVVLLDFSGHGANTHHRDLQSDLDVAVAHLRSLADVDPARVALVGHSMGATAVTTYAAAHPDITSTVAISLPYAEAAAPGRPARLLLLVGGLEFPGFHAAAADAVRMGGPDRRMTTEPGVEHITILYAPSTHRDTVNWLDQSFGGPLTDQAVPWPPRRLTGGLLLVLAFLSGMYPLAWLLFRGPRGGGSARGDSPRAGSLRAGSPRADSPRADSERGDSLHGDSPHGDSPRGGSPRADSERGDSPRGGSPRGGSPHGEAAAGVGLAARAALGSDGAPRWDWPTIGRCLAVGAGAALVGAVAAPLLPTNRLPLAIGGYVVGLTAVTGIVILLFGLWRPGRRRPPGRAGLVAAVTLVAYAIAAIALPVHFGLTHARPVGPRWWLLAVVWAGFALLAYAAERLAGGHSLGVLAVSAVVVVALSGAAAAGLTNGFVLLVVPPLALLFGWQAIWSAMLNRFGAPAWLTAVVGSVVVAWPIAAALPLTA